MAQQKATANAQVASREVAVAPVAAPVAAPVVDNGKFRDLSVGLNQNLATLTLDYDTLKKKSMDQQKADQKKIELLQNERTKLNNNLAKMTLQYDEDIAKKNRVIKSLNHKLNFNNARRSSVVAKIQKIERLTDMSTNLNGNLARVTLEFNEMVQSKDEEINKLKNSLKNYENAGQRRNSTIVVEYNNVNINQNAANKVNNKEMGSPSPAPTPVQAKTEAPAPTEDSVPAPATDVAPASTEAPVED